MRLRWTNPAANDLYNITQYIQKDNLVAASRARRTVRCEV